MAESGRAMRAPPAPKALRPPPTLDEVARAALLSRCYDAHTHLHLDQSEVGQRAARVQLSRLTGAALMGSALEDWPQARRLSEAHPSARCLLGVHPWFAHRYPDDQRWRAPLEAAIDAGLPGVGEIGLDKQWRTPDTGAVEYAAQRRLFAAQLQLAGARGLPVSVHCVRAQGDLYEALSTIDPLPPTIYLHAFGGAAGTVEQLTRARCFGRRLYFGFAACINLRSPKGTQAIAAVPSDRLLLESDRSSAARSLVEDELIEMLSIYAQLKGWATLEEAAEQSAENARRWLSGAH